MNRSHRNSASAETNWLFDLFRPGIRNICRIGISKARNARNRDCIRISASMGDQKTELHQPQSFWGRCVHFVVAAAFSALMIVPASAQDDATLTLNFQDADIRALINTVSQVTGRNFVVDPRVKGKVTVVSGKKMSTSEIYNVFLSVLEVHNFAAVPSGNVTKILPSNIVKQRPTPMSFDKEAPSSDAQVTQVYQLQHSSVQQLVPILRPLLPPTSHFAAHAPTNTLVFTDTGANIKRVMKIIERIDQPDRRSDVHVVYLKNARASAIAKILSQLVGSLVSDVAPQAKGAPVANSKQVSVQADDSLNAIIVQSPETEFKLIQAVIDQLDVERPAGGDINVIYLKYANAKDLVAVLNNLVASGVAAGGEGAVAPAAKVTVEADESNNALIVRAEADKFREIKTVVEQLDRRRAQVFVETIIAEVSMNEASELGVTWNTAWQSSNAENRVVRSGTTFSEGSGGLNIGFLKGLVQVVNNDGTVSIVPGLSAVLSALRSDGNTNVLSTPNLLTLDNESAQIVVGQEVPFVTGQFSTPGSTTTDTETNTTNVNAFQTIERKDVGLTLEITPQINEGDTIQLDIKQEISNVSQTTVQGQADLITDTRSIEAKVQVDDGQIIVLGGLIQDNMVDSIDWVPILGDIPVLGALFRKKSKSTRKTNLMVFLRPKVLRTPEDLAELTETRYRYMQGQELRSQPKTERLLENSTRPVLPPIDRWSVEDSSK